MAQLTHYAGTWSKEGLSTSPLRVPRSRGLSPRSRSRSVYSPQHQTPRLRFASGQHTSPLRPVQLFGEDAGVDSSYDDWESEDSAYFNDSPMIMRRRDQVLPPSRNPPQWPQKMFAGAPPLPPVKQLTYSRVAFNFTLALVAIFFAITLLRTINNDIAIKVERAKIDLRAEIAECTRAYQTNYCKDNKSPALIQLCTEWDKCMNLDPDKVSHVTMSAGAVGEIIEAFVGPLDYRSMAVLLVIAFGIVFFQY